MYTNKKLPYLRTSYQKPVHVIEKHHSGQSLLEKGPTSLDDECAPAKWAPVLSSSAGKFPRSKNLNSADRNHEETLRPLFEIRSAYEGLGMFALRDIEEGTGIIREAPMVPVENATRYNLELGVMLLYEEKRTRFFKLQSRCTCRPPILNSCYESEALRIFSVNKFRVPAMFASDGKDHDYIYENASRINHACFPNSAYGFTKDHCISFRAVEDIQKGQEITYDCKKTSQMSLNFDLRQKYIKDSLGFTCHCPACVTRTSLNPLPARYAGLSRQQVDSFEKEDTGSEVIGLYTKSELEKFARVGKWCDELGFVVRSIYGVVRTLMYNDVVSPQPAYYFSNSSGTAVWEMPMDEN